MCKLRASDTNHPFRGALQQGPSLLFLFLFECEALPAILSAPDYNASGSKEFAFTNASDFICLSVLSQYKTACEGDFNGEDVLTRSVKTEAVEAFAKGLMARTLPDAVSSSARDHQLSGRGSPDVQHRAAAQIGVHAWKGR